MAARFTVSEEVRQVLAQSTITPTSVKLVGTLDRKLYLEVNKVLVGAGGKWDRKSGTHLFSSDPREILGLAVETGQGINKQQLFQSYYTPDVLADKVAELADLQPGMCVLEPSCGEGALIRAAYRAQKLNITAYEIQSDVVATAIRSTPPSTAIYCADFLEVEPLPEFDRVLMNPPFTKGQDMLHVQHAWKFLKPGGRLVAIMSPSWQTGTTKLFKAFQAFAGSGYAEKIPAGTFSESGTEVAAILLRMDKPLG